MTWRQRAKSSSQLVRNGSSSRPCWRRRRVRSLHLKISSSRYASLPEVMSTVTLHLATRLHALPWSIGPSYLETVERGLVQVRMLTRQVRILSLHALPFANALQVLLLQKKSDKVEEENKFLAIALDDLQDSSSRLEAENRALKMGASPAPLSGLSGGGNLAKVGKISAEFCALLFRCRSSVVPEHSSKYCGGGR